MHLFRKLIEWKVTNIEYGNIEKWGGVVFEVKFDVTAFDVNIFVVYVPVFDITTLYH